MANPTYPNIPHGFTAMPVVRRLVRPLTGRYGGYAAQAQTDGNYNWLFYKVAESAVAELDDIVADFAAMPAADVAAELSAARIQTLQDAQLTPDGKLVQEVIRRIWGYTREAPGGGLGRIEAVLFQAAFAEVITVANVQMPSPQHLRDYICIRGLYPALLPAGAVSDVGPEPTPYLPVNGSPTEAGAALADKDLMTAHYTWHGAVLAQANTWLALDAEAQAPHLAASLPGLSMITVKRMRDELIGYIDAERRSAGVA